MRASDAVRPASYRRRYALRRVVTHDLPLKSAAVLIAILFWIAVAQNAAPRTLTVAFDGRVAVERPEIPAGYVLRAPLGDVGVTLRGPEGVVTRVAVGDLRATVDTTSIDPAHPEPQEAPVRVAASNPSVTVVDVSPATVTLRYERITSQQLSVQTRFANDPPAGSHAGDVTVTPNQVRVTGPESSVGRITAVLATVRFGDAMTDVTSTAPLAAVDAAGQRIDEITLEPSVVIVTVPVLPTATTRTLPVAYVLRGAVASGYWVSAVTADPAGVTVRGEPDVLASLDRIETATIDVAGLSATRTFRVALVIPQDVTLLRPVDGTVTVTVLPVTGTRPFVIAVQVTGLGQNLAAEVDPVSVVTTLSGTTNALAAITPDQVSATVDATGLGPGTYTVDVLVRAPSGTTVQSVQPVRATLTIRAR